MTESEHARLIAALNSAKAEAAAYRTALLGVFDAIQAEAKHTTNHDINVCDELLSAFRAIRAAIGKADDVATEIDEAANEHGDEVTARAVAASMAEGESGK